MLLRACVRAAAAPAVLIRSTLLLDGAYSKALKSWNADGDMCSTFVGVSCNGDGLVQRIDLSQRNLTGVVPKSWSNLTTLTAM